MLHESYLLPDPFIQSPLISFIVKDALVVEVVQARNTPHHLKDKGARHHVHGVLGLGAIQLLDYHCHQYAFHLKGFPLPLGSMLQFQRSH